MENRNYKRLPYSELRDREYLKPKEVELMLKAAKKTGKNSTRNYAMVLLAYRHGLRVGELVRMKWSDVDFDSSKIFGVYQNYQQPLYERLYYLIAPDQYLMSSTPLVA